MIRFKQEWKIPSLIGVGSFCIGAGLGYILGRRTIKEGIVVVEETTEDGEQFQFQFEFAQNELFETYSRRVNELIRIVDDVKESLTGVRPESYSAQIARDMHAHVVVESRPPPADPDEWDYEVEMRNRSTDHPYTIHQEEYIADENEENGYHQVNLTYYAGDDVLCDEQDTPIYNPESIVGQLKFGHGSGDPMVVYVRNDKLQAEYEIQLEIGKYSVEILGARAEEDILNDDIKHGNAIHKFRKD